MGKGRKRRKGRRGQRKKRIEDGALHPQRVSTLAVSLPRLTIAKGHDGLFRGSPEPTLLVGVFLTDEGPRPARTIARGIWRFQSPSSYPSEVATKGDGKVKAELVVARPGHIAVLAVAVEEDAGSDIRDIFAAMEDAARFELWRCDDKIPTPLELPELTDQFAQPCSVHLQLDHVDLRKRCRADDFVAAQVVRLSADHRLKQDVRFHFRSEDDLNDWTAVIHIRL